TISLDDYAVFFDLLFAIASALTVLMAVDYLATTRVRRGEEYSLLLFSTARMMTVASAPALIVIFLALEVVSRSVYMLAGAGRPEIRLNEAAIKYFLLGAFARGFLLFGIALVYAVTGPARLEAVAEFLGKGPVEAKELLALGIGLLVVG